MEEESNYNQTYNGTNSLQAKLGKINNTPPKRRVEVPEDHAQINEGVKRLRSLKSERHQMPESRDGSNNRGSYAQNQAPVIEVEQLYVQPRKKIYLNELPRSSPSKNKRGQAGLDELITKQDRIKLD